MENKRRPVVVGRRLSFCGPGLFHLIKIDGIAERIGHGRFARLVGKIAKLARIERVCLRNGVSKTLHF